MFTLMFWYDTMTYVFGWNDFDNDDLFKKIKLKFLVMIFGMLQVNSVESQFAFPITLREFLFRCFEHIERESTTLRLWCQSHALIVLHQVWKASTSDLEIAEVGRTQSVCRFSGWELHKCQVKRFQRIKSYESWVHSCRFAMYESEWLDLSVSDFI